MVSTSLVGAEDRLEGVAPLRTDPRYPWSTLSKRCRASGPPKAARTGSPVQMCGPLCVLDGCSRSIAVSHSELWS